MLMCKWKGVDLITCSECLGEVEVSISSFVYIEKIFFKQD